LPPQAIEEDRFFNDFAWEEPLGQARDKDRVEAKPARCLDRTYEDPVRKKLGLTLLSEKPDVGPRRYRIPTAV
jgi:hypothetical protein